MSGSVENRWAMTLEKDHLAHAFQIAKEMGKPQDSFDGLVAFLKVSPADTFNQFNMTNVMNYVLFYILFGPVVESMSTNFNGTSFHGKFTLNFVPFFLFRERRKAAIFS